VRKISQKDFKKLYRPAKDSHKGQNGKLTIIGGSRLFHGASLWALKIASRIVDMVYYSSVPENNRIAEKLKPQIFDFIAVPRDEIADYLQESDAVLMGPGLMRTEKTKKITKRLLFQFPSKKWILDAGSLQMMDKEWLKKLDQVIVTPHWGEFKRLFGFSLKSNSLKGKEIEPISRQVQKQAQKYGCVIVLKGPVDIVCSPQECAYNTTGNQGMTKGGTGDVLAGLIAALACKNDLFLSACAGVYFNGLAGDQLYQKVGVFYNASDLCNQVCVVMKKVLGY